MKSNAHTGPDLPTGPIRQIIHSVFMVQDGPGPRVDIAARAAISLGVPLAIATILGYPVLGLQAAAGAFLAIFYAGHTARERAKTLPFVMLLLLLSAVLGVLFVPIPWLLAAGLIVVATGGGLLVFAFRAGAPGPVFFVMVYGLAANITMVLDGERINDPIRFLVIFSGGLVFSYLVALAPLVLRRERRWPARPLRELIPRPWMGPGEQQLVARILLMAVVAVAIHLLLLDIERAYWTVASGVAVIGLSADRRFSVIRGTQRMLGTLVGVLLALPLAPIVEWPWAFVATLVVLQFVIELVVVRNYSIALAFITPLVLLLTAAATGTVDLVPVMQERVLDTIIGSALAMLTALVHRPGRAATD